MKSKLNKNSLSTIGNRRGNLDFTDPFALSIIAVYKGVKAIVHDSRKRNKETRCYEIT